MALTTAPYKPSWVDRFLDWLDGLPLPNWMAMLAIYLIVVLMLHASVWIDGVVPFGTPDGGAFFNGLWSVIPLFFLLNLDRIATRAVDKFSVLVPSKRKELERIRYEMTNIPARPVLALTMLMATILLIAAYFDPAFLYQGISSLVSLTLFMIVGIFSYSFAPILLYHGVRQLNLVAKAYRLVGEVNLFRLQPLYAFSGLTMVSSLFWVLLLNMNLISNAVFAESETDILFSTVINMPFLFLAFATFLFPLWGIHRRIQNKKEAELDQNGMQVEKSHQTLYRHLNKNDFKKGSDMEKSLASLYRMREQIEKVPTWPWNPGTLRSFLSAVFLPLGVWLLQQVLSRFL